MISEETKKQLAEYVFAKEITKITELIMMEIAKARLEAYKEVQEYLIGQLQENGGNGK